MSLLEFEFDYQCVGVTVKNGIIEIQVSFVFQSELSGIGETVLYDIAWH